eukprot:TRINITY_DN4997_c1_g1_i1.p1 TRINITY_DN4997_c1_g1~~TRINITY_DN4997_c1_g1_i1.p1  ORF type:complete len:431 (+),score=125.92 TRINITY_DN4997_c1_g1_i1:165-1295(+)
MSIPDIEKTTRRSTICKTEAGNDCDMLTITNFTSPKEDILKRERVVITARIHSGESGSSFVIHGIIAALTGFFERYGGDQDQKQKFSFSPPQSQIDELLNQFVFKIIPMLNPDGVIEGNHRCSLSGEDLNRSWPAQFSSQHPTLEATKWILNMASREEDTHTQIIHKALSQSDLLENGKSSSKRILNANANVNANVSASAKSEDSLSKAFLYLDLHCHFRRKNIFMYCCNSETNGERIFPFLVSQNAPCFAFDFCSVGISADKTSSGRAVAKLECGVPFSYAMESSFGGMDRGQFEGFHLNPCLLLEMGRSLTISLIEFRKELQQGVGTIQNYLAKFADLDKKKKQNSKAIKENAQPVPFEGNDDATETSEAIENS